MCTGYRRDALPCASTRACTRSAHHGANHLSPHRRMAMLLVWLRGELWDQHGAPWAYPWLGHWGWALCGELWAQHGAPLALPLGLGCAGNCGFMLVPLAHPKIVSEIVDWCWRPADVASCRACVGTRVVPRCRACGDCGRAPLVVVRRRRRAAASLLSRRRTPLGRGAETPGECMTCSVTVRAMSDVAGLRRGRHATLPRRRARRPGPPAGRSGVHRPSTELVLADSAFTTRESGFITGPSPCDKNGP